jgi:hypothetical protein
MDDIITELNAMGWPAQLFNSGGYVMVIAVYEQGAREEMNTSHDLNKLNVAEDAAALLKAYFAKEEQK